MSRSMYNDTTKGMVIGIDAKRINKFSITAAGVVTYAAPSVDAAGQLSIATMPIIGFTCIKAGVRVYSFAHMIRKTENTLATTEVDSYDFMAAGLAKSITFNATVPKFTVEVFNAGTNQF